MAYISVMAVKGAVTGLFFSLMGTWGYSSGVGSAASQAQLKPPSTFSTSPAFSAGNQPSSTKAMSVSMSRALFSSLPISWAARSAQRRSTSRFSPRAARAALHSASSRSRAAMRLSRRAVFSAAVPVQPRRVTRETPKGRMAS